MQAGAHRKALFGGALISAGITSQSVRGQISEIGFEIEGDPGLLDAQYNPDTGSYNYVDLSFSETGGLELLPFSRRVNAYDYGYSSGLAVFVDGDVDPSSGGGSFDFILDVSFNAYSGYSSAFVSMLFTLDRPGTFSIDFNGSPILDFGFISLFESPRETGNEIAVFADFSTPADSTSLDLSAGSYELVALARTNEQFQLESLSFTATIVPVPATASLLVVAGLAAARRRR